MSEHDRTDQHQLRDLVKASYADVRFSESMTDRVREQIDARRKSTPRWVEVTGLGVAAVALFAVGFNAAALVATSTRTAPPEYVITDLPGAAISYQEAMQP